MNKLKIWLSVLLLTLFTSHAYAGPLSIIKKNPLVAAGAVVYLHSTTHISRDLSFNLDKVGPFFEKHPEKYGPVSNYVLKVLAYPANKKDYDRYKKLAEIMDLRGIPPYVPPTINNPVILPNPQQEQDPNDGIYENPIVEVKPGSNIIFTPQGEPIDTTLEYPNTIIPTWEDYLIFKQQSEILAENMKAANQGTRPKGYAAHHIVAWDDNRYPVCQDLRDLLNNNGIDINDAENGVYLPTRKLTKNNNEAYHPEIHTDIYYNNVYNRLRPYDGDTKGLKNELKDIAKDLKNNQFKYK